MTKTERLNELKRSGWTYDPQSGLIKSHKGKVNVCNIKYGSLWASRNIFAWFYVYNELPKNYIWFIDGDKHNTKIDNLSTDKKPSKEKPKQKYPHKTLTERLQSFKDVGWTYDPLTGYVITHKGKIVKNIVIRYKYLYATKHFFAWFYIYNKTPQSDIWFIDGNKNNTKIDNLSCVAPIKEPIKRNLEKRYTQRSILNRKYKRGPNYINKDDFLFEIIISKGKGKLTKKACEMIHLIVEELSSKFGYNFKVNTDRYDCKQEALFILYKNWYSFNEEKYDNALSYFTEVAKRAMASGKNIMEDNVNHRLSKLGIHKISLSAFSEK